jgi:formylglycine-generating enzyme required for sulfatase activity
VNWSGGKVGAGKLYQGLHKGTVDGPQDGNYESPHAEERRWHELANGERIYDFSGNVWTWVFDNVQGNEEGIVSKPIGKDSLSRSTLPEDCYAKGGGYVYDSTTLNWSSNALVRGGRWFSESSAGVFRLDLGWPVVEYVGVGFRCTK